jgi:hypothetical protein
MWGNNVDNGWRPGKYKLGNSAYAVYLYSVYMPHCLRTLYSSINANFLCQTIVNIHFMLILSPQRVSERGKVVIMKFVSILVGISGA